MNDATSADKVLMKCRILFLIRQLADSAAHAEH